MTLQDEEVEHSKKYEYDEYRSTASLFPDVKSRDIIVGFGDGDKVRHVRLGSAGQGMGMRLSCGGNG
jgi:hypothetical protein